MDILLMEQVIPLLTMRLAGFHGDIIYLKRQRKMKNLKIFQRQLKHSYQKNGIGQYKLGEDNIYAGYNLVLGTDWIFVETIVEDEMLQSVSELKTINSSYCIYLYIWHTFCICNWKWFYQTNFTCN